MRVHVTVRGKRTTISVDDVLIDYLGAYLVREHSRKHHSFDDQQRAAKACIARALADDVDVPERNLSQHIQALIIKRIAAPGLDEILAKRGAPKPKRGNLSEAEVLALAKSLGIEATTREEFAAILMAGLKAPTKT